MQPRIGSPESFGFVRCRARDTDASLAWERPDGFIVHAPRYDPICVCRIGSEPPFIKIMKAKARKEGWG